MKVKTRLPIVIALLAVLALCMYWAYDAAQLYVLRGGRAGSLTYNLLFDSTAAALPAAALLGTFFGTLKYYKAPDTFVNGSVERHNELMFTQHWSNALGIVILLITGIGLGIRLGSFYIIPRTILGVEHIGFAFNMHFIGILFYFFGASFYITEKVFSGEIKHMLPRKGDLKGMIGHYKSMLFHTKAPEEEKFIYAERTVFPGWVIGLSGVTITGIFKVLAHFLPLPAGLMGVMTFFHGFFAIFMGLMLVGHVFAAAVIPPSWPMLRSMITGKMKEDYVKHHHVKWYQQIMDNEKLVKDQGTATPANSKEHISPAHS